MHDGEYISENFTISEPCEDMDYDWAAIQGNDGGYVNVELVNYETEESFTLANKVLDTRWELHSDNKPIKDVAAGEYFIRSTTFPTFFVELRCERPWE
jgi:hypothetical protein